MQKTPTPILYNEHLVVGSTLIEGTLTTTNEDGSLVPETGAYVYIYLNNILINEDSRTITSGEGRAGVVTVVGQRTTEDSSSLPVGYWSFPCKALAYGSYITVKAQTPNKIMSDYSITHRVGGLPVPTNIVSLKKDGTFGPPVQGDTIIEGEFSGLKNRFYNLTSNSASREENEYVFPYNQNFDLYPYIDGIKQKALVYNQIVSRNFISDFTFFGDDFDVDLLVQGEPVNIKVENFSQKIYEEIITGVTQSSFVIHPPTSRWDLLYVYYGGLRLTPNTTSVLYDYYISHSSLGEVIVVLNSGFVVQPSDYFCIQYVEVNEINRDKYQSLVYQESTQESYIIPYADSYCVYKNGLRMLEGENYDFTTLADLTLKTITITFNRLSGNNIILSTDTIVIDYKVSDDVTPFYGVKNQSSTYITPFIEDKHYGTVNQRSFFLNIEKGSLPDPSYITIYKDGIKQKPVSSTDLVRRSGDFTLQKVTGGYYKATFFVIDGEDPFDYTVSIVDGVLTFTINNNFVVDFVYSIAAKEAGPALLNILPAMVANKITSRFETDPVTLQSYLVFESPYTLEFPADSTKYQTYFGKFPYLFPGKDSLGHFKFFIDFKRNKWRYWFEKPLRRLMHLTAATFIRST